MNFSYTASVIICTFNRRKILEEVLNHLDCQVVAPDVSFEVIIVDDGSTDTTQEFVQRIIEERAYRFDISYDNTGLTDTYGTSVARNKGIKKARGEYLLFLDDDTIPHTQWMDAHLTLLQKGEKVLTGCITYNRAQLNTKLPITVDDDAMRRLQRLSEENNLTELMGGNVALSRECIERAGLFDERFALGKTFGYEDIEYGHRLLIAGFRIRFNPNALIYSEAKPLALTKEREAVRAEAKKLWWHILTHPQEGLPVTPLLYQYAARKKEELAVRTVQGRRS
ncbi:MAG: glycosyltransferase [Candidatus Omnitrophica bacterium]|nr:glycosyltransferase [Candidatus Omnitrophota bacterium]